MRDNQPSTTAENNAALRALESLRPVGERICYDPYARYFVSDEIRQANDMHQALLDRTAAWEILFPGVCDAIIARTRFIDDCLERAIEEGIQQLVILGAGYDTRALRFKKLKDNITVFEVDHPATQQTKRERFPGNLQDVELQPIYVPVIFGRDDLGQFLFSHGYDRTLKSFFIWEGITYYISAEAVDNTLLFVSENAPADSSVVFDYFPTSVVNGSTRLKEARSLSAALKQLGEEFVYGLDPKNMEDFLLERGLEVIQNIASRECKQIYFKGSNRCRKVSDMFIFAQAKVSRKGNKDEHNNQLNLAW